MNPLRFSLRTWVLVLLAAGASWRVLRYALGFPLWGDEAFVAVNFLTRAPADMVGRLDYDVVAPIGFMTSVLAVVRVLGPGEYALRLLPMLAGLGALILFSRLASKILGRHAALAAIAIFSASYYLVRHGSEVKPYAFDLLAAAVVFTLGLGVCRAPGSLSRAALLAAFGAVAVWFSYPVAFVAGGVVAVLFIRAVRRRDRAEAVVLGCGAALLAASFCAMYALVGSAQQWRRERIEDFGHWAEDFPPLAEPWRIPVWLVRQHVGNMMAYPNGFRPIGSALTTIAVILGAVALWRRGRRFEVLLLLSPLPLMFVAAALHKYPYGGTARTTLHLAIPFGLLAGAGFAAVLRRFLGPRRAAVGVRVFALGMLAWIVTGAVMDVVHPWKLVSDRERRDLVRELADASSPRDCWVVFGTFGESAIAPDLVPYGGSAAALRYYSELYAPCPIVWAPETSLLCAKPEGRTWLIAYEDDQIPFARDQWMRYRAAATACLGAPDSDVVRKSSRNEITTVLGFESGGRAK